MHNHPSAEECLRGGGPPLPATKRLYSLTGSRCPTQATRICAILLSPIVPDTCRKVYTQLGFTEAQFAALTLEDAVWRDLPAGQVLPEPEGVFSRLEPPSEVLVTLPFKPLRKRKIL